MRTWTWCVAACACVLLAASGGAAGVPPPRTNISALIAAAGYPVEEVFATTADGYTLRMQRIPNPGRPAVLLQHGLVDSAATWLINEPNESLGFILHDAGYDVFLGNVRGNGQSYDGPPACPYTADCFYAFSWDQMATLDLPALVAAVKATARVDTIGYVGHSQGTMMVFAGLEPGVASSIAVVAALAPVARVYNVGLGPFKLIGNVPDSVLYDVLGRGVFNLDPGALEKVVPGVCALDKALCNNIVCLVAGCDSGNLNSTRFDILFHYFPSPTSVQDMAHFKQGVKTDTFQAYDYGSAAANMAHYNASTPPLYNPAAFATKVGLFSGGRDKLADPTDVAWLRAHLPPAAVVADHEYPDFGHADFVWGLNAHKVVYPDVLALFHNNPW